MDVRYVAGIVAFIFSIGYCAAQDSLPKSPDVLFGELFVEVQMNRIFPDGKTFADCVPLKSPDEILKAWRETKKKSPDVNALKQFVEEYFELPPVSDSSYRSDSRHPITSHIQELWKQLRREPDTLVRSGSLLPLPHPYIVPGGRFREIYYWDSYFTLLGLKESREYELMENMVDNFAYLINRYGHVPNGNRSYYLSRSQPPFFFMMVELLATIKGDQVLTQYLPALEKEYQYWMEGATALKKGQSFKRVVSLPDDVVLNRYWDEAETPRPESYREDIETAGKSSRPKPQVYSHLRAAAASGWDFSGRWFADGKTLSSIETANIIPVDLNSLLVGFENALARAYKIAGQDSVATIYSEAAEKRQQAIEKYCWSREQQFYTDYNFKKKSLTRQITAAGLFPFVFFSHKQGYLSVVARQAATVVQDKLLAQGGLLTSSNNTGEQWDAPNGWAPLQWMAVSGLARSGQIGLAKEIAQRWTSLNEKVYSESGKLMEKYNVLDLTKPAGGGEYAAQDGFGWTNGVYLALSSWLNQSR